MTVGGVELDIQPVDRVLSLSVPPIEVIREISAALDGGGLVSLGRRDEVFDARRAVRDLHNVMLHPGPPEDVPFDDAYFSKILDLRCEWEDSAGVAREVARALADRGRAYLNGADAEPFTAAGLRQITVSGSALVFERPERPRREPPPFELPVVP